MTGTTSPLSKQQTDILAMAHRRGTYTAFSDSAQALCAPLVSAGYLKDEGDFCYAITAHGAQAIGAAVRETGRVISLTGRAATSPSVSVATPLPVLTQEIIEAYRSGRVDDVFEAVGRLIGAGGL